MAVDAGFMTGAPARSRPAAKIVDSGVLRKVLTDKRFVRVAVPLAVGILFIALWEWACHAFEVPKFVLPAPSLIVAALADNFTSLMGSLWITFRVTVSAFVVAVASGVAMAIVFTQSRVLELALFPYAVVLQVTPVVSIAPLVLIWVGFDNVEFALLILAWLVAFFPILSNTTLGLSSADHNLRDLMQLYGASRWQLFRYLQMPGALPYLLGGMKISGGLALIGAVVAEFVAGSGGSTGLAWRIIESGNQLRIPNMFAALILLSGLGIVIFFCMTTLQHALLHRWHESAVRRER